jgi:hypothetical protein
MSDRDKDAEILALRHQITVLERQLSGTRVRFTAPDRAFLAALLHRLTPEALRRMRLPVRPDTVLRWHRDLVRRRHAARPDPTRTEAAGPAADGAFHPCSGAAAGPGEPELGVRAGARRTAGARGEGRMYVLALIDTAPTGSASWAPPPTRPPPG